MINELIYKGKMNDTVPTFNALFSELIGLTNVGLIEKLSTYKKSLIGDPNDTDLKKLIELGNAALVGDDVFNSAMIYVKPVIEVFGKEITSQITSGEDNVFDKLNNPNEKTIIYLRVNGSDIPIYKTIMGLFFQHSFRIMKNRENLKSKPRPTLCYLDEFGNYKIGGFSTTLTTIRKFNVGIMIGLQAESQILDNYGNEGGTTILGGFNTRLYMSFKPGDQTPRDLVEAAGQHDVTSIDTLSGEFRKVSQNRLKIEDIYGIEKGFGMIVHGGKKPTFYQFIPPRKIENKYLENPAEKESLTLTPNQAEGSLTLTDNHAEEISNEPANQDKDNINLPVKSYNFNDPILKEIEAAIVLNNNSVNDRIVDLIEAFYLTGNINYLHDLFFQIDIFDQKIINEKIKEVQSKVPFYYLNDARSLIESKFSDQPEKVTGLLKMLEKTYWDDFQKTFLRKGVSTIDIIHLDEYLNAIQKSRREVYGAIDCYVSFHCN